MWDEPAAHSQLPGTEEEPAGALAGRKSRSDHDAKQGHICAGVGEGGMRLTVLCSVKESLGMLRPNNNFCFQFNYFPVFRNGSRKILSSRLA